MRNIKYLSEDIIIERLESEGWIEVVCQNQAEKLVLDHYDATITDDWNVANFYIYEETTVDSYSIFVATPCVQSISVNENIYYYDSDLGEALKEAIENGYGIFCELQHIIDDTIDMMYSELLERKYEEVKDELLDEGYCEKITDPVNTAHYIEFLSQNEAFNPSIESRAKVLCLNKSEEKYQKYEKEIRQTPELYKHIFEHFGLTVTKCSAYEIIIKELEEKQTKHDFVPII